MSTKDIRWKQRLSNYNKAFAKLEQAVNRIKSEYANEEGELDDKDIIDDMLKEALIQRFEYTHELAWKVMKDYLVEIGNIKVLGSKDATKEAFSSGLNKNGEVWMDMIDSRNMSSHTYNEETANEIFTLIMEDFYPELKEFCHMMEEKRSGSQGGLFNN